MFDKLKQLVELKKLRDQAVGMQRQLAQEKVTLEEEGIKIVVNGNQEIEVLEIDNQPQKRLAEILNKAIKQVQQKAALKMTQMTGGLGGLLGS